MTNEDTITDLQIMNLDGEAKVTSLVVAEKFGKRHDNILREIKNLAEHDSELAALNFEDSEYLDKNSRPPLSK